MRSLPLLAAAVIITGIAYWLLRPSEPPPESAGELSAVVARPEAQASQVPYLIKAKVRAIHEQLLVMSRSTSRGDTGPARVKIGLAANDIEEKLRADGIRQEATALSIVRAAAAEAGFDPRQTEGIVSLFLANRSSGAD
jgi:hypothetical protein